MKLQVKRERWQCAVTAFAMALDIEVDKLMEDIGHDGGEKLFPSLEEPMCRRGHHPQELIHVALQMGYAVTPIELYPVVGAAGTTSLHVIEIEDNWARFIEHINNSSGVLQGAGLFCNHMVAYQRGRIFDPDGGEYDYSRAACEARRFYTTQLWRVHDLLA